MNVLPPLCTTSEFVIQRAMSQEKPPICEICSNSETYDVIAYKGIVPVVVWYTRTLHKEAKTMHVCKHCHWIMAAVDDANWPALREYVKKIREGSPEAKATDCKSVTPDTT